MSFVVARMQKLKADNLIGLGNHDQRKTSNHSNQDIDASRSYLNYDLVAGRTRNFKTDIQGYINEHKTSQRAVRKDAVLANEWIVTSDKRFFEQLDEKQTRAYFEDVKQYFADKFGDENIRYAVVHLDEHTPHMHMGIVPFDKDYKLSAKRVFNREVLQSIQEDLPKYLQERGFDVQRGVQNNERKNLTVPEYKQMKQKELDTKRQTESHKKTIERHKQYLKEYSELTPYSANTRKSKLHKGYTLIKDEDLSDLRKGVSAMVMASHKAKDATEERDKAVLERDAAVDGKNEAERLQHNLEGHAQDVFRKNATLEEENRQLRKTLKKAQSLLLSCLKVLKEKLSLGFKGKELKEAGLGEELATDAQKEGSKRSKMQDRKNGGMHL